MARFTPGQSTNKPECWCATIEGVNQRALVHPDSVWTLGTLSGSWAELQETIENIGGSAQDVPIWNDQGNEVGDLRDLEICVPDGDADWRPDEISWTSPFGPGTRPVDRWKAGPCKQPDYNQQCWKQKFFECGLDNTYTSFRDTGATLTFKFSDCPDSIQPIPDGTGGWTQQITEISAAIAAAMPDSFEHGVYCTNGCGGLPQPVVELPDMKWRYAGWRVCPGDKTPIEVIYNSDQRKGVLLDLNIVESPVRYFDRCSECGEGGAEQWFDCATKAELTEEETAGGKPICTIPCASEFPAKPDLALCDRTVTAGCLFDGEGNLVTGGVTQLAKVCDDVLQVQYLVQVGETDQQEVQVPEGGYFGDCATGDPIPEPPVECEADTEECCIPPDPENRDRWCVRFTRPDPFGDGDPSTTYAIRVGTGAYVALPNPHTHADIISVLNAEAPGADWAIVGSGDDQYLCRFDGPGNIATRVCGRRGDGPIPSFYCAAAIGVQSFVRGDDPECRCYLRTWSKYEEPIADDLAAINAAVTELLEKYCANNPPIEDCPETVGIYCDEDGTKYKVTTSCLGTTVVDEAGNPYEPTAEAPQLCEDAEIVSEKCKIDECGTRWTCVTTTTVFDGMATEGTTYIPYQKPEAAE